MYTQPLLEAKAKNFNIGICAKIRNARGETLLVRRSVDDTYGDIWEMPGGAVDPGETLEEALSREIREETGLTISKINRYIDHFDFNNIETGKIKRKFCFEVTVSGKIDLSHEHSHFKWFTPKEIEALRLQGEHDDYQIWQQHYAVITS